MRDVVIAVVQNDDRFLVGVRPEGTRFAGLAEFPGGKLEPGETFMTAATRECLEETGIGVEPTSLLQEVVDADANLRLQFWRCQLATACASTTVKAPFRWVARGELLNLRFPPANAAVVSALIEGAEGQLAMTNASSDIAAGAE